MRTASPPLQINSRARPAAASPLDAFVDAIERGAVHVRYRGIWDFAAREVVGIEAVPLLEGTEVWSLAREIGAVAELVDLMEAELALHRVLWEFERLLVHVSPPWSLPRSASPRRSMPLAILDLGSTGPGLADVDRRVVALESVDTELQALAAAGSPAVSVVVPASASDRPMRSRAALRHLLDAVRAAHRHRAVVMAAGVDRFDSLLALRDLGFDEACGPVCGSLVDANQMSLLGPLASTMRA